MTIRRFSAIAFLGLCLLAPLAASAQAGAPSATDPRAAADALFDRAANMLAKDSAAARPLFARAAAAYEHLLAQPLSRSAQARVLTNAGAAHHLAGDLGHAMLDLRRAELLSPATPNLRERLVATRAALKVDATPSAPGAAPTRDASLVELARDLALSAPRPWLWRIAAIGYVCFWSALLLRLLLPSAPAPRPGAAVLIVLGALCAIPAAGLAGLHFRDAGARSQAVVLSESIGRSEPDDLTGAPSSPAPLKPGTELRILDQRVGGDGRTWIRVTPLDATPVPEDVPVWIPDSATAGVAQLHR